MTPRNRPPPRSRGRAAGSLRASSAALLAVLILRFAPPAAASGAKQAYDLPGGDASKTLGLFSEQSGEQILFPVKEVRGVQTRAVKGDFTPREALERMVEGTNLVVIQDQSTGALAVHRASPKSRSPPESASAPTAGARPGLARSEPTQSPPARWQPAPDETIKLPTFVIISERDAGYIGQASLGTTRAGVTLDELPQSVVVLNRSFLDDLSPTFLAKSLLYVGGAQTGTITWSVDRNMIRGFVGEGDYVDGFRTQTDRNTDLNLIDHIEVIKGPAAIFIGNMNNTVGGVINKVSKSPTDYPEGALTVQAGLWDANRADLDVGGPLTPDRKLSYRLLLAGQDTRGYYDHTYEKRTALLPMLAYKFSDDTQLWLKFEKFDSHYSSYNGLPLDGRTDEPLAVPARTNLNEDTPVNWRTDWYWRVWGQLVSRLGDHVAMRTAAFDSADYQRRVESILSPSGGTVATVNGVPVLTPQYVVPPNYLPGTPLARNTTAIDPDYQPRREVQQDFVFAFRTGPAAHKLLLGVDAIDYPEKTRSYSSGAASTASSSPIDPFAPSFPGSVSVNFGQPPVSFTSSNQDFSKIYGLETASLLRNRVILSWGASRNRFETGRTTVLYNQVTGATTVAAVPDQAFHKNLAQVGLLIKPVPGVSVFYGENRNFASNGFSPAGVLQPPQQGRQREAGVKSAWLAGRLRVNVSYFDIIQLNNAVAAYPQTNPLSNVLVNGTISRGFDGDVTAELAPTLDLVGSFASFHAHVPLPPPFNQVIQPGDGRVHADLPVDNASERNFALWVRKRFTGRLQGFAAGVGVHALARRAITDNNNQVFYGYVPGRTLADAMLQYDTGRFRYQLNVDNVFNERYVYAARSNQVIVPGTPANLRFSVVYKFF